jgi:hypothetical protein
MASLPSPSEGGEYQDEPLPAQDIECSAVSSQLTVFSACRRSDSKDAIGSRWRYVRMVLAELPIRLVGVEIGEFDEMDRVIRGVSFVEGVGKSRDGDVEMSRRGLLFQCVVGPSLSGLCQGLQSGEM